MIGARLGSGREADVYAWGDEAVVKLYRPGFGGHRAEAAALAALNDHAVAPKLVDVIDRDGRAGLILQRLHGPDMLTLLQRQPWRMHSLARTLAKTHLAIHTVKAPPDLPELRQLLAGRIEDATLPPQLRAFALRVLDGLPAGDRLCHGDYHPGNVLLGADRVSVIDWPGAARGVPAADHARTVLLLRQADPLPGTPLMSRALMAAGRYLFARGYARSYSRGLLKPLQHMNSWLIVHAAARLSENIDVEQPRLIRFLDRARHRAAP